MTHARPDSVLLLFDLIKEFSSSAITQRSNDQLSPELLNPMFSPWDEGLSENETKLRTGDE